MLMPAEEGVEGLDHLVRQGTIDGVVVFDIEWHDSRLTDVAALQVPTVLIGTTEDAHGLPCVDVDYRRIAQLCVNYLAQVGSQRMVLMNLVWSLRCWECNMTCLYRPTRDGGACGLFLIR